jgi:hypothetical protein
MSDPDDSIFGKIIAFLGGAYIVIAIIVATYLNFKESASEFERVTLTHVPNTSYIHKLVQGFMWPYTLFKKSDEEQWGVSHKSNTSCDAYSGDSYRYPACLAALKYKIPIDKVMEINLLALVDRVSKECGMNTNKDYRELKSKFNKSTDYKEIEMFDELKEQYSRLDSSVLCEESLLDQLAPFFNRSGRYQ